jgi:hypothetical protein
MWDTLLVDGKLIQLLDGHIEAKHPLDADPIRGDGNNGSQEV